MTQRNIWIGEIGCEQAPVESDSEIDAIHQIDQAISTESVEVDSVASSPLSRAGLSLDELVPRPWKKW